MIDSLELRTCYAPGSMKRHVVAGSEGGRVIMLCGLRTRSAYREMTIRMRHFRAMGMACDECKERLSAKSLFTNHIEPLTELVSDP